IAVAEKRKYRMIIRRGGKFNDPLPLQLTVFGEHPPDYLLLLCHKLFLILLCKPLALLCKALQKPVTFPDTRVYPCKVKQHLKVQKILFREITQHIIHIFISLIKPPLFKQVPVAVEPFYHILPVCKEEILKDECLPCKLGVYDKTVPRL